MVKAMISVLTQHTVLSKAAGIRKLGSLGKCSLLYATVYPPIFMYRPTSSVRRAEREKAGQMGEY